MECPPQLFTSRCNRGRWQSIERTASSKAHILIEQVRDDFPANSLGSRHGSCFALHQSFSNCVQRVRASKLSPNGQKYLEVNPLSITIELDRSRYPKFVPSSPLVSQSDFARSGVLGCRLDVQVAQVPEKQLQEVELGLNFPPNGAWFVEISQNQDEGEQALLYSTYSGSS